MCLAIPARLVEYLDDQRHYGKIDVGGVLRKVNTALLTGDDTAEPGDYVLIHVGFAMSKVSAEEAEQTMVLLRQMGELFDEEYDQLRESTALEEQTASPAPAA
ncbi:MAG: HypC/HybG/HupF family hydrogenase formation chaperone [Candidatus Dormibacteria bacterium]